MKHLHYLLLAAVLGCASSPEGPDGAGKSPTVDIAHPPQSALTALVRCLEVLDALHDPRAEIRLRAVTCDTLIDREHAREYVRVLMDVSVLAQMHEDVDRVFEDMQSALEAEAASTARPASAAYGRVERVFAKMDWSAASAFAGIAFRHLVSLSESIRLEVAPGQAPVAVPAEATLQGSQAMVDYIEDIATDGQTGIGDVLIDVEVQHPRTGIRDLRYHIRPAVPRTPFHREQIGRFLYELEARSPGVKVTRIVITPVEPGADVEEDLWTFEAAVSIRTEDR